MTALIEEQMKTMIVMIYCGMTIAIVYDIFDTFICKFFAQKKLLNIMTMLSCYIVEAFIIGEFIMYCQNGKLIFYEMVYLALGLLLWRRIVYNKINSR